MLVLSRDFCDASHYLAEVCRRAQAGEAFDITPALIGGIAEYLFKRWAPWHPPPWIKDRARYLDRPYWPVGEGDPALMEYLTWASPPEFKSRNVMTDEAPLRRATQPPVEPLRREGDVVHTGAAPILPEIDRQRTPR